MSHDPRQNRLLAAPKENEFQRLAPHLPFVPLKLGEVLCESGGTLTHVYFPTDSIVSLLYVTEDGASAEIAVVGNEGILCISLFMGGGTTPSRAIVQSEGFGYRMPASTIKQEFGQPGPLMHRLLRHTQTLMSQMSQTALCNRHQFVDKQLCRWLLMSLDSLGSDEIRMTQELIANMHGVRREGITQAAGRLRRTGIIDYKREHTKVLSRRRLEQHVCECCAVV